MARSIGPYTWSDSEILNVADDGGFSPGDDIDTWLDNNLVDNTLIEFPSGNWDIASHRPMGLSRTGIAAAPGTNPTLVPKNDISTQGDYLLTLNGADVAMAGLEFDYTTAGRGGRVELIGVTGGGIYGENVTVIGTHEDGTGCFRFDVRDANETGVIENWVSNGGGDTFGIFVGAEHAGTLSLRNCEVASFNNNGLYASAPGDDGGGGGGVVQVEGGTFRNNNIAGVRIGTTGSYVKDATIIVDGTVPDFSGTVNARGIRFRDEDGMYAENCTVTYTSPTTSGGAIVWEGSCGQSEVRDCTVQVDVDINAMINAKTTGITTADPTILRTEIKGSADNTPAIEVVDRDGFTVDNCCIELTGSGSDGINAIRSDGSVVDTNINVNGTAIVETDCTVTTTNLTTDQTCDGTVGADTGGATGGSVSTVDADWWVDPANGTSTGAGTQNDPLDTIFRFDENESYSLSAGDTVALVDSAVDTLPSDMALSFDGDPNGDPITIGTWVDNGGDYVIDFSNTGTNATGIYQFQVENLDWIGAAGSRIVFRGAKNHAMKQESASGQTVDAGVHEYLRFEDYGNDSTDQGGNGIWIARGVNGGVMRDCEFYDGHEPGDSDGVYFGGPSGNRPGGWLFERCEASYNADDGFDFFRADSANPCLLIDCVAHHNGRDQATWDSGNTDGTSGNWGDGNGFKMGGDSGGDAWLYRCLSYTNKGRNQSGAGAPNGSGFDDNGIPGQKYINCTSYNNEEWGFRCATDESLAVNCLAYQNGDGAEDGAVSDENNSWDLGGVSLSDADFKSVTEGSDDFLVPADASEIVDAGVVVDGYTVTTDGFTSYTIDLANDPPQAITETFSDASPDLGYVESTGTASSGGGGGGGGGSPTAGMFVSTTGLIVDTTDLIVDTE